MGPVNRVPGLESYNKSENLSKAHYAQLRSYLKATNLNVGLLVNFSKNKADFRRVEIVELSP